MRPFILVLFLLTSVTLTQEIPLTLNGVGPEGGVEENLAKYGSGSVALAGHLSSLLFPASPSAPAVDPETDIVITDDPVGLPQNEPAISVNPLNPLNIVVAANDYRLAFLTATGWIGYYTSIDGGRTWINRLIPGFPYSDNTTSPLADFDAASDPSVAFDLDGNTYIAGIVFNIVGGDSTDGSLFVTRSSDGGFTFPFATIVNHGSGPGQRFFNDKPYLTVDRSPSSPFKGRIYVSWTQFNPLGGLILHSFSKDQGTTWSSFKILGDSDLSQGAVPAVGPAGEVYVTWLDLTSNTTLISNSLDGGVSFSQNQVVYRINPIPNPLPNTLFRTNNFPTLAVDDTTGAVYVAWNDYGLGNSDILFTRSTDRGATWSFPLKVNDVSTPNDQFFPWMTASNGSVSIVFYDRRLDPSNHDIDIFLARSTDGGLSFGANIRVSDAPFNPDLVFRGQFIGDYIGLASGPGTLHPVWADNRNVDSRFYLNQDVFTDVVKVGVYRDVTVNHLSLSRSSAYSGVQANPVLIEVGIANLGTQIEDITISTFLNSTSISTLSITGLEPGRSVNATVQLNTSSLTRGVYRVSATITNKGGENVTMNNALDRILEVRCAGDANADGSVNFLDIGLVGLAFLANPPDPHWNPEVDINNDSSVNFLDLGIIGSNFLKQCNA